MTAREPVEIGGETFDPVIVPCPNDDCEAEIDAQRALLAGACPNCGKHPIQQAEPEESLEDYEADSYKPESHIEA
jgi:hypothetical protein